MVACDDQCGGGGSYSGPPPAIGTDPGCFPEVRAHVNGAGANVNVLFQHGFASNANTWCDGSDYLRRRFVVGNELRHSLDPFARYEDQAGDLEGRVRQDIQDGYGGPYVFVGHSNGGIISRYAAQDLYAEGAVRGVVTVSTPNAGVPLARLPRPVMAAVLVVPAVSKWACQFVRTFVCGQSDKLVAEETGVLAALDGYFARSYPVVFEMTPNNSFYAQLNARGAPYPHAAVVNTSWDLWTEWRLVGDRTYCGGTKPFAPYGVPGYPQTPNCGDGGRRIVNSIDKTYHRYLKCAVVSGILGFFFPGGHAVTVECGRGALGLKSVDLGYHLLTVGHGSHGDGVVPESSQRFPDASPVYPVYDADSHIGLHHSYVRTLPRVADAVHGQMGVPFAQ